MIYTVTFNPSIDYIVDVDHFQTGMVNRTTGEHVLPGGKGINVFMRAGRSVSWRVLPGERLSAC